MKNTKVVYFFRGNLRTHVGLYKTWVDLVKNEINITLLTFMSPELIDEQKELVTQYRGEGVKIYSVWQRLTSLAVFCYFLYLSLKYKKVVVHLRKQPTKVFKLLKSVTLGRLSYLIDLEGDFESEIDYLSNPLKKYKTGFYDAEIAHMKKNKHILEEDIKAADGVLVPTKEMKKLFMKRYEIKNDSKFSILPTAFDTNKFFFDISLREKRRKEFGFDEKVVLVFAGNVYYSWQNLKRSLQVFELLKKNDYIENLHFLILTRPEDFSIVEEFICDLEIDSELITVTNVPHNQVNDYLNAADIGILLREDHQLNKIVSTGKLGEYLACGLPVITSIHVGHYSEKMEKDEVGVLLKDIYSDHEVMEITSDLLLSDNKRQELSDWALEHFSVSAYKAEYLNALERC